jgi:hypothetical protein
MNKKKFKIDWNETLTKIKDQETKGGNSFKDEREYRPQFNDKGIAQAVIRFLPSPDTDIPFAAVYSHGFKGPGGWYIENCPTTLKKECPTCKANSSIWDEDPDLLRQSGRKRKLSYYSNILVVKDPQNPENEGKVWLFRYGKKIHDMIMAKIQPADDSIDKPIMVFDYYDGADFKLKIKNIKFNGKLVPNYDDSSFTDTISPIGSDEEIEKIHAARYNLAGYIDPKSFKSYDELAARLEKVTGTSREQITSTPVVSDNVESEAPKEEKKSAAKVAEESVFDGTDDEFFDNLQKDE